MKRKGIVMAASVASTVATGTLAARVAQPKPTEDSSPFPDRFTRHLEQAQDAARREAAPSRPTPAARKSGGSTTVAGKSAKQPKGDTAAENSSDAAPTDATASSAVESTAQAGPDLPSESTPDQHETADKSAKPAAGEKPPAPLVDANNAVPAVISAALPTPSQPASAAPNANPRSSPQTTNTDAAVPQPANSDAAPAPTPEATAKAEATATAFDAKLSKSAAGRSAVKVSPLDDAPAVAPKDAPATAPGAPRATPAGTDDTSAAASSLPLAEPVPVDKPSAPGATDGTPGQALANGSAYLPPHAHPTSSPAAVQSSPPPPEVRFAETNHTNIVSGVQTNLLPHGGTMQIRLDPPELGALQITVQMHNGSMTATFQTTNDDATRMLSHSLGQLKTALESQGVNVEKIQVQQAPRDHTSQNHEGSPQQQLRDEANARQEQQRREMLQKMWRRVSGTEPMDLVA